MPLLRFRAIEAKDICTISTKLIDDLENLLNCPRSYFSLEVIQSIFIQEGSFTNGAPLIDISLFDRGQETQDAIAKIVTKHMKSVGYNNVDIVFTHLNKNNYYENEKHF